MIDSSHPTCIRVSPERPHEIFTAEFAIAAAHEGTACHYAEIEEKLNYKTNTNGTKMELKRLQQNI